MRSAANETLRTLQSENPRVSFRANARTIPAMFIIYVHSLTGIDLVIRRTVDGGEGL